MNSRKENVQFDEVKRRLRPGEVFQSADHEWKTQKKTRWKGSCPWHESSSGTCFTVNPETLEWKCFSCDRGGGPLQYVAELENVGTGAHGSLKGQDFFKAWEALSRHAGCEGPPDLDSDSGDGRKNSDRKPRCNDRRRSKVPRRVGTASTTSKGAPSMSRDMQPRGGPPEPDLETPERELRKALSRYRKALTESEKARRYVERRGLSVETLHAHGCGFAPAGEWIGSDNAPRLVTPHTTPSGEDSGARLVNLDGRYVGSGDVRRHDRIGGNPTKLFNALAVQDGTGPIVFCEGPFDALSFIEAGWERTVALHNPKGVPWESLDRATDVLVFAFDRDEAGREGAEERRRDALLRDFDAHTLDDEDSYAGHGDPNEALQAGELTLDYLEGIGSDPAGNAEQPAEMGAAESRETAAKSGGPEADRSPTRRESSTGDGDRQATAADLVAYWNGDDIGHLGRWLWERGGVPDGDVGGGVYADRELHEWIEEALQAGPDETTGAEQDRLRFALWRLYAAHGPEEVPEEVVEHLATPNAETSTADDSPPRAADLWEERPRDPYRLGRLPETVGTTRTDAPTDNPHEGQRGIEIDSPYSEDFVHDLKVLPEWARTWNGEAWVVDDCFAAFAGDLCRQYFG